MSAVINALFGGFSEEGEQQNIITDTTQTVVNSECLQTSAIADDVQVKSVISSETQVNATIISKLNIDALLAQLSTTHAQIDQYSQAKTAEINEQIEKSVAVVLENTRHQQEELLTDANQSHLIIDNEYKIQLKKAIEILDDIKAKGLAALERDLQEKQQLILNEAKKQIDLLNDQANAAKLNVLIEAQEQAKENIDNLANQVAAASQKNTENVLQSTAITIITSQAQAAQTIVTEPQSITITDNQLQVADNGTSNLSTIPVKQPVTTVPIEIISWHAPNSKPNPNRLGVLAWVLGLGLSIEFVFGFGY